MGVMTIRNFEWVTPAQNPIRCDLEVIAFFEPGDPSVGCIGGWDFRLLWWRNRAVNSKGNSKGKANPVKPCYKLEQKLIKAFESWFHSHDEEAERLQNEGEIELN